MTLDDDALRAHAAKHVDDPTEVEAFMQRVKERLEWRRARGFKTCARCREDKKPSAFGANPSRDDGLHHSCLECERARRRVNGA